MAEAVEIPMHAGHEPDGSHKRGERVTARPLYGEADQAACAFSRRGRPYFGRRYALAEAVDIRMRAGMSRMEAMNQASE